MTSEAIRDGFARLRSDDEMQPLASAARSRNEADWLVGINATAHLRYASAADAAALSLRSGECRRLR
jgi:Topoisomerase IA